jgi:hypothetical protein
VGVLNWNFAVVVAAAFFVRRFTPQSTSQGRQHFQLAYLELDVLLAEVAPLIQTRRAGTWVVLTPSIWRCSTAGRNQFTDGFAVFCQGADHQFDKRVDAHVRRTEACWRTARFIAEWNWWLATQSPPR